jgi:DNA-3-methyladenine glycosylase
MFKLMAGDLLDRRTLDAAPVLRRKFYQRPTVEVAHDLLGKLLVRRNREGIVAARIVEVEAYLGPTDPACHTYGGRRTRRVATMWGEAGRAYVYLIYGVHHCLNLVTVGGGAGEAVLVRGAAIVHGRDLVHRRRGPRVAERALTDGPGKLGQALGISLADDGRDVCDRGSGLWLCDDGLRIAASSRRSGPRIGVRYAGDAAQWPLRFVVDGNAPGEPAAVAEAP